MHISDNRFHWWVLLVLVVGVVVLAYGAPNDYTNTDPRFSLLVSQTLLEEGTTRLNTHAELLEGDYRSYRQRGHVYYAYPPGPSLFSVPAVWVARQVGYDLAVPADDFAVQRMIAAGLCGLITLLLYLLTRRFVSAWEGVVIAAVMMLSTLLIGVMGTALWNVAFVVVFELLVLWLVAAPEAQSNRPWQGVVIGVCLWGAFLSRPTAALFVLWLLLYMLVRRRPLFWWAAGTAAVGLVLWMGVNVWQIEQPLTPYYQLLGGTQTFGEGEAGAPAWVVLYGILFGPSRGLFVFAPLLLLALVTFGWAGWRRGRVDLLAAGTAIWIGLHILLLTRFDGWWGGVSFGPRLLVDTIPGFALLLAWSWPERGRQPAVWRVGLVVSVLIGLYINSYAALYDRLSWEWNGRLMLPRNEAVMMLDWRYPQFWMSHERLCQRSIDYHRLYVEEGRLAILPLQVDERIIASQAATERYIRNTMWYPRPESNHDTDGLYEIYLPQILHYPQGRVTALFGGWGYRPDVDLAFTACPEAVMLFGEVHGLQGGRPLNLELGLTSWGRQEVTFWLNGNELTTLTVEGEAIQIFTVPISADMVQTDELNELTVRVSDPAFPYEDEKRQGLGLQLVKLTYGGG